MVVVVTPSIVNETSLTTVLLEEEPSLPLAELSLADVVLDDESVPEVAVVDEAAVVAVSELTELMDMARPGLKKESVTAAPAGAWPHFFNVDAGQDWRSKLFPDVSV